MRTGERLRPGEGSLGLPSFPLGPGRGAYSKRARGVLGITLAVFAVLAIVLGAILATGPSHGPLRVVTIPAADRTASPALLRAAEAVGFEPHSEPNAGRVESETLVAAQVPSSSALLEVGAPAPAFSLKTPTGATVSLRSLRGRVVLLEFFATWCPHCAAEAPHLERLFSSFPRSSVAFVGVNADGETAPSVLAYHIYFGLSFPVVLDPGTRPGSYSSPGLPGPVTSTYRVSSYPTFYVLDRAGRITWAGQGEQPDLLLQRELRLAGRSGAGA